MYVMHKYNDQLYMYVCLAVRMMIEYNDYFYADYIFDFAIIAISVGAFAVLTTIIHLFNFDDFKVLLSKSNNF